MPRRRIIERSTGRRQNFNEAVIYLLSVFLLDICEAPETDDVDARMLPLFHEIVSYLA